MKVKGQRIVKARNKAGLTQEKLAAALGVSKTSVKNWESGLYGVSPSFQQKLVRLFGVEWETLFG